MPVTVFDISDGKASEGVKAANDRLIDQSMRGKERSQAGGEEVNNACEKSLLPRWLERCTILL